MKGWRAFLCYCVLPSGLSLVAGTLSCLLVGCGSSQPASVSPPPPPLFQNEGPIHQGVVVEGPVTISDSLGVIVIEQIQGFADQFGKERVVVALKDAPKIGDKVYFRSTTVLCNTSWLYVNGNMRYGQDYGRINTLVDGDLLSKKEEQKEEKTNEAPNESRKSSSGIGYDTRL